MRQLEIDDGEEVEQFRPKTDIIFHFIDSDGMQQLCKCMDHDRRKEPAVGISVSRKV